MLRAIILMVALAAGCNDLGRYNGDAGVPPDPGADAAAPNVTASCAAPCHGSENSPAPPLDVAGNSDTTAVGVGAHESHLAASTWRKQMACSDCHVVPAGVGDPGHIDTGLPAEVTFGALAGQAAWDGTRCSNAYCHGGALSGGSNTAPEWTKVDGSQAACGSCHGLPPPAPHPNNNDCGSCHPTMNPGAGLTIAYPELHIDGKLDVTATSGCDSCHGSGGNPAPPNDTAGNTLTTVRGVGAHRNHLAPSSWHKQVACNECHVVPAGVADLGHVDTALPAELTFGTLAGNAAWNGTSCSGSYCHGATLTGGAATSPQWTRVDGTQAQCGSCHGAPPPAPHPNDNDCGSCHPTMTPGGGLTITYPEQHINGNLEVNVDLACDACHGSGGNPAPPVDLSGNTATTATGVGAHRRHLEPSVWHKQVECTACHLVPTGVTTLGHTDTPPPAELTFGAIAGNASWNGTSCSNAYCHGASLSGGTANTPVWTRVDGAQAQCGSCHGTPPPAPHPNNPDCGLCHNTMTPGGGLVIAVPERHIDGNLDVNVNVACDNCHGSGGNPAPPQDVGGNTQTNTRGVGAHRNHLAASGWHKQIECSECHQVPAAVIAVGHADTPLPAELTFGPLAGNVNWNGTSCANSYCHGAGLSGGATTVPQWTKVDGTQAQCDSCHGAPPPAPHPNNPDCGLCHPTMNAGGGLVIADPARHIDGNLDVVNDAPCDTCHGSGGNPAPPQDVGGNTLTTVRGVGAHRNHLAPSNWHTQIQCTECHKVPAAVNTVGHADTPLPAELTFGTLAGNVTWNGTTCAGSYCHGSTLSGGAAKSPTWTKVDGTQSQCGSCHGAPPPPPHPNNTNCGQCHESAGNGPVITNAARHIDGVLQVTAVHPNGWSAPQNHGAAFTSQGPATCATAACHGVALDGGNSNVSCNSCHNNWRTDCTFCHGGTDNNTGAPPESVAGSVNRQDLSVGAHTAHVEATTTHAAWGCDRCHVAPSEALSPGHIDGDGRAEAIFSAPNGAATYNYGTGTCGTLYCHGNGRAANGTAQWTSTTSLGCSSCHASDAGGSGTMSGRHRLHLQKNYKCSECHNTVVNTNLQIINLGLHVNGARNVSFSRGGNWDAGRRVCSNIACHGSEDW